MWNVKYKALRISPKLGISSLSCCCTREEIHRNSSNVCFGTSDSCLEYKKVRGTVLHCWTVHHISREGQPSFADTFFPVISSRDRNIVKTLSFSSYRSPSYFVQWNVVVSDPSIPAEDDFNTCSTRVEDEFARGIARNSRFTSENSE